MVRTSTRIGWLLLGWIGGAAALANEPPPNVTRRGAASWRLDSVPPRAEARARAGIVRDTVLWFARRMDDREITETVWFAHAADGAVTPVTVPRAVFAWEGDAFAWRATPRTRLLRGCQVLGEDGRVTGSDGARPCAYADAALTSLRDGRPRVVFRGDCDGLQRGEREQHVGLVGQLGPWLVIDVYGSTYHCGPHGNWSSAQYALDLRGGALRPVTRETVGDLAPAAERSADAELRRRLAADHDPMQQIERAGAEPVGRFDAFDPMPTAQGVSWHAVVGAETCYLCPPYGRRSYWTDVTVPMAGLPDAVRGWSTAPPEWAAELARHPSQAAGWSTFVGTVAARDRVLRRLVGPQRLQARTRAQSSTGRPLGLR